MIRINNNQINKFNIFCMIDCYFRKSDLLLIFFKFFNFMHCLLPPLAGIKHKILFSLYTTSLLKEIYKIYLSHQIDPIFEYMFSLIFSLFLDLFIFIKAIITIVCCGHFLKDATFFICMKFMPYIWSY